jgi:cytochrome d ubiquinol oxidase subunit II
VPPGIAQGDVVTSWVNPTSVLGGIMAILVCAYLAAVFLCGDARREGEEHLVDEFRTRALGTAAVTGVAGIAGLFVLRVDAPLLWEGLTGRALPVIALSVVAGVVAIVCLVRRQYVPARLASSLAVTAILAGWAVAQYPYILVPELTIEEAATGRPTLVAMLVALAVGAVVLVPALVYLYRLFQRSPSEIPGHHVEVDRTAGATSSGPYG